jgi:hypothetical protein
MMMRNMPFVMLPMRESRFAFTKRAPLTSFTNGAKEADSLTATVHGLLLGAVYVRTACVAVVPTKVTEEGCAIAGATVLATARQIAVVRRVAEPDSMLKCGMSDIIQYLIAHYTPRT